jgi:hypothetical protein
MHSSGNELVRFKIRLFIISSSVFILICSSLFSEDLYVSSVSMAAWTNVSKCYGCRILTEDSMNQ